MQSIRNYLFTHTEINSMSFFTLFIPFSIFCSYYFLHRNLYHHAWPTSIIFLLIVHKSVSPAEIVLEFQTYIYNSVLNIFYLCISSSSKSACLKSAFILFLPSSVPFLNECHHPSSWPNQKSKLHTRPTLSLWHQSGVKWLGFRLKHWWKWMGLIDGGRTWHTNW